MHPLLSSPLAYATLFSSDNDFNGNGATEFADDADQHSLAHLARLVSLLAFAARARAARAVYIRTPSLLAPTTGMETGLDHVHVHNK